MSRPFFLLVGAFFLGCAEKAPAMTSTEPPIAPCDGALELSGSAFEGHVAAFVWHDPVSGNSACYGPITERRVPASTFKIPHALIALDSDVLEGPDALLTWDSAAHPAQDWWPSEWAQDHTLASALEHSVVWYYQEVARLVGPEQERSYLEAFGYGNAEVGDNPTSFWLVGPLSISPQEQIDFLQRLWQEDLPADLAAQRQTRQMITVLSEANGERVLGKTGTGRMESGSLNWLVGVVERREGPAFFAFWIEAQGWIPPSRRLAVLEAVRNEVASSGR